MYQLHTNASIWRLANDINTNKMLHLLAQTYTAIQKFGVFFIYFLLFKIFLLFIQIRSYLNTLIKSDGIDI